MLLVLDGNLPLVVAEGGEAGGGGLGVEAQDKTGETTFICFDGTID